MPEAVGSIALALVVAVAAVAGFVTGLAGFGTGLVAAGLWLYLLPASFVPPLAAITSASAQLASLPAVRRAVRWRDLSPYLIGAVVGVPLGVLALRHASSLLLRPVVGVLLVVFATSELSGLGRVRIGSLGGRRPLSAAAGGLAATARRAFGLATGHLSAVQSSGAHGGNAGHGDRWAPTSPGPRAGGFLPAGDSGWPWLGVRCYGRVDQGAVRRVVLGLLLLSGLTLLVSA